ncbi:GNAT family N-acetyltransferase [Synechococcus sp. RSCCF101]|uniref:GNAT family N-acetyltransferase n=1 Tax=Synechococcus sp. RSCCF101 TaxID=2511069 RepID=UPI001CDA3617|nr:GNAT family N-acetyltransferase [Synechococcus sp. RSCCF101]
MAPRDEAELRAVYVDAIDSTAPGLYSEAQVMAWRSVALLPGPLDETLRRGIGLVSEGERGIEAFAVLHPSDRLALLYCRGRSARQGRAAALLDRLEAEARRRGCRSLRTEASLISRPLLERRGWQVVAPERIEIAGVSFDRFRMALALD